MARTRPSNGNRPLAEVQRLRWLESELQDCLGLIAEVGTNGRLAAAELVVLPRMERFLELLAEAEVLHGRADDLLDEIERRRAQEFLKRRAERCHSYAFSVAPKLRRASQIMRDGTRKVGAMKERLLDPDCTRQEIWRMLVALEAYLGLAESELGEQDLELMLADDRPPAVSEPTAQLSLDFAM